MSPQTDQTIMSTPDFDLLRGTASETRALLDARRITCTQLVQRCLDQMEAHNKAGLHLNAAHIDSTSAKPFEEGGEAGPGARGRQISRSVAWDSYHREGN